MKQPLKISSQKLPWALLGIMIIIASFLQVITYYSYNKLDNAVQTFIVDIREAKDDKEAEEIFIKFVGDVQPLIGTFDSGAGFFGRVRGFFGGGKSQAQKDAQAIVDCYKSGFANDCSQAKSNN